SVRWAILIGVSLHVALLLYQTCSTLLVAAPIYSMMFMVSLLAFSGPSWRWVLLAGVGLHLGILLSMEIGWFSQVALCYYALFVPGEKIAEAWRTATAWLRGGGGTPRLAPPLVEEARGAA